MIISSFELELAREHSMRQLQPYAASMADDPPAQVNLLVHVDSGFPLPPGSYIGASLFIMQDPLATSSPESADVYECTMPALENERGFGGRLQVQPPSPSVSIEQNVQVGCSSGVKLPIAFRDKTSSKGASSSNDLVSSVEALTLDNDLLRNAASNEEACYEREAEDAPPSVAVEGVGYESELAAVERLNDQVRMDHWVEVENIFIGIDGAREFTYFTHCFDVNKSCQIRVEFFRVDDNGNHEREEVELGYAVTTLRSILEAPCEHLEVNLVSMDHSAIVGRTLFGIKWNRGRDSVLAFEVRIKVDKKDGWPFSSYRPFFVLYRLEYDGQWIPLYLSEVRVKPTRHPLARGCMLYNIAEVNVMTANGDDDRRILRLEFFHYKTTNSPHKFLGSVTTSVMQLRQAKLKTNLGLQVNTFPNAELVGSVILESSRVTAKRSWFCLYAEFGGKVQGHLVYIDMALEYAGPRSRATSSTKSGLSSGRPHYRINRVVSGTNRWEVLYRSELPSRRIGSDLFRYKLAKITAEKLTGKNPRRKLAISLHTGESARVGQIYTSLSRLVRLASNEVLDVSFGTVGNSGYLRVDQKELTETHTYLALRLVLSRDALSQGSSDGTWGSVMPANLDESAKDTVPDAHAEGQQQRREVSVAESQTKRRAAV